MIGKIKSLRSETGIAIAECRKALEEAAGDLIKAKEILRKKSMYVAANKSIRTAKEGAIIIKADDKKILMLEVNCETDFNSRSDQFKDFLERIASFMLAKNLTSLEQLEGIHREEIESLKSNFILTTGENVVIRRLISLPLNNNVGFYNHNNKIGSIVSLEGGDKKLANELAMHIVAFNPMVIRTEDISQEILDEQKEIFMSSLSDKSLDLQEKIVAGKLKKFAEEQALYHQKFLKDETMTVEQLLKMRNANLMVFHRFQLGYN